MQETLNFTAQEVQTKLKEVGYYASDKISHTVALAINSNTRLPIIVEGDAGVGKTSLAKAVSKMLDAQFIKVQFYEGITYEDILYDYDYQKQLLVLNTLKDKIIEGMEKTTFKEMVNTLTQKYNFYDDNFIIKRPLLQAISGTGTKVLLLDEIDKSSEELEYTLLEVLSEYSITIPQYGTIECSEKPIVFLTSNAYRDLSMALKRRCGYLYIDQQTEEEILNIITEKQKIDKHLASIVAKVIVELREKANLKQNPSLSEAIVWANILASLNKKDITQEMLLNNLGVICKSERDIEKATQIIQRMKIA